MMVSGGRLDEAHQRVLREALPRARCYVRYGVTELTAAASYLSPEVAEQKLGSIGRGLPGLPLEVHDEHVAPIAPGSEHGDAGRALAMHHRARAHPMEITGATELSPVDGLQPAY